MSTRRLSPIAVIGALLSPAVGAAPLPDGFVYLRESQTLLHETRILIKNTVEKSTHGMNPINVDYIKENITDEVSRFLLQKTAKRPMVIPVILTV